MKTKHIVYLSALSVALHCFPANRIIVFEEVFTKMPKEHPDDPENDYRLTEKSATIIQYNFTQHASFENNIENIQKNVAPETNAPAEEPPKPPSFKERIRDQVIDYATNPLVLGAAACIGYIFYCASSKFSLYSLGKACIEKAAWSLWKHKATGTDLDDQDTDTALLIQILNTYNTESYTTAVARFLHDVEAEADVLTAYVRQAKNIQEGTLRFIFADVSDQIKQAEERLESLNRIKKVVMGWLIQKKTEVIESSLALESSGAL